MKLMVLIVSRKAAEIQFQYNEAFIYILNNNNNTNLFSFSLLGTFLST